MCRCVIGKKLFEGCDDWKHDYVQGMGLDYVLSSDSFMCLCVCVLYSGCADRKGEGGLQRLRGLHCSGGRLSAREALCWERWGQQVRHKM